jgi:hypothetical protein
MRLASPRATGSRENLFCLPGGVKDQEHAVNDQPTDECGGHGLSGMALPCLEFGIEGLVGALGDGR